ncbi:MAG: NAD(P)-dependent oxidoreductase [bacterium]
MLSKLPSIVITGASGFIGRFLLENLREEFTVFAIARRSRKESNIPYHKNIHWIQCDIANRDTLNDVLNYINNNGGADYLVHLAAFYDFTYEDNPEYQRTNIDGTQNILNFAKGVKVKRLIFASSLAACNFPNDGENITENSLPDADYAYARSKKIGEQLVKEYSNYFPCSIIRFAAVYSDWCEYAPLYKFLSTWLSKKIDSRMLAGKGDSAIPYLHVHDIVSLIRLIIKNSADLHQFSIYNASPDGSVSHKELFRIATAYFFGKTIKPIHIPKLLAYPGLIAKQLLKYFHLVCEEPFEKFWMIKYIDKKLNVDSSFTRKSLAWEPAPRFHINRRLLFLLEKIKSHPDEWRLKNEAALHRVARRNNLIIYEALSEKKDTILPLIIEQIGIPENKSKFDRYKKLDPNDFQCYMSTLYHLLMATVRSGDRSLMIQYIDDIAIRRFAEGFQPFELCETLSLIKEIIIRELSSDKELKKIEQVVYDYVGLTLQLAQDEIEDLYDKLLQKMPIEKISESSLLPDCKELQRMIRQLSAFYQISPEDGKYYEELH